MASIDYATALDTLPAASPVLSRDFSLFEQDLYSIWGVTKPVSEYLTRGANRENVEITEKYEPNENDKIKILSLPNDNLQLNSLFVHATLLIQSSNDNKTYSMGFGSGNNNKLCIYSPDPVLITFLRNQGQSLDNIPLVYEDNNINEESIEKLNIYLNARPTTASFPARRPVLKVCYDDKDYKPYFSRQRGGFNCWTALEDIFPEMRSTFNLPEKITHLDRSALTIFRGGRTKSKNCKRNKSKNCKRNKSNTRKRKRNKSKIRKHRL